MIMNYQTSKEAHGPHLENGGFPLYSTRLCVVSNDKLFYGLHALVYMAQNCDNQKPVQVMIDMY